MFYLISGGSGSGKSEFAENVSMELHGKEKKEPFLYIATMMAFEEEAQKKIERHRAMRKGKGFTTLECFTNLKSASIPSNSTILLECLSNLVANEMFSEDGAKERVIEEVTEGVEHLLKKCRNLVIVTNEIFSDGCPYDETTRQYIRNLGRLNQHLAKRADKVVEVVCGIVLYHKGGSCDIQPPEE